MKNIFLLLATIVSLSACKKDKNAPTPSDPGKKNEQEQPQPFVVPQLQLSTTRAFARPCGLAISQSGMMAVTEYNGFAEGYGKMGDVTVWKSYSDMINGAAPLKTWMNTAPEAVVFDENDNLYVAETELVAGIAIYKRTNNGGYEYLKTIQGGLNNPRGLAIHNGALYVADDGNNRVIRYDNPLTGNNSTTVITGLGSPKGICIDGGSLYVTEYNAGKVSKYTIGSWDAPQATVSVSNPVDVTVKNGLMIAGQPGSGILHLFSAANPSDDNKKQVNVGGNLFGMAFSTTDPATVYVATFDKNTVSAYLVK